MKCAVIQGGSVKKIERRVNEFLENNPNIEIKFITQAGPSSTSVITTIFYE